MITMVKTPLFQKSSPAAAKEGADGREVGRGEGGRGREKRVQARSTLELTAPKARSRSREVTTLDETPRISLRVSAKLPIWDTETL